MPCRDEGREPTCNNPDHVIAKEHAVIVACELGRVLRKIGGSDWMESLTARARAWLAEHEKLDAVRAVEDKLRRERRLAELREQVRKLEQDGTE